MSGALQAVFQNLRSFLTRPSAPTIGTATATGGTTATVSYTASSSNGGSTITSYTAVSSPSGGSGTLSTSGSGTINVTGLTASTSYTFTVYATNAIGNSASSSASNSITTVSPPSAIGAAYQGGYYAGSISTAANSVADYYLVIGPKSSAQAGSLLQWKTSMSSDSGTTSVIDGPGNSTIMNNASHPAAQFCKGLSVGGYSDWYMPAKNELEVCFYNLKARNDANNTSSGANLNAVPSRSSNYTTSDPALTSVTIFQTPNSEAFNTNSYWASTEYGTNYGWNQNMAGGAQNGSQKTDYTYTRAIRRVAV